MTFTARLRILRYIETRLLALRAGQERSKGNGGPYQRSSG